MCPTRSFKFLAAMGISLLTGIAFAGDERVQLWQYQPEQETQSREPEPKLISTRSDKGDYEILFEQLAPCGEWLPVNPDWKVQGSLIQLNFDWVQQYPNDAKPLTLCKKFVRAWVFYAARKNYKISFGKRIPRFVPLETGTGFKRLSQ